MTLTNLLSGAIALVPWLVALAGLAVMGLFAYRVGLPLVRIAELRARVDLLSTQLETAQEQAKTAVAREQRCVERLEAASARCEESDRQVRVLVDAIAIKNKLEKLADSLQPKVVTT